MKTLSGMLVGLLVLGGTSPACLAQTTIDVSKITCDQLVLMKVADPDHIAIWLSGYYHGMRNNTKVDVDKLQDDAKKVRTYCLWSRRWVGRN